MMDHTKEPWKIGERFMIGEMSCGNDCTPIYDKSENFIGIVVGDEAEANANARRIAACVNYCQDLDTELMERATADGYTAACAFDLQRAQVVDLMFRRDEALDLLKRYRHETPLGHQPHMIAHEVDALIEKSEWEI